MCTTGQAKITEEIAKCVPGKCSPEDIASTSPLPFSCPFPSFSRTWICVDGI
ncbi:hypothetical protein K505DRAFT_320812 [Melanomma pulvis-pyrius CBS 109.77]|uniref:Extracellular membrane protein CFEM domain-containing protein n=1 Tax=Melanomma pulvis-pyrius CBS 109.77 TaxID=1314802 RepID=A0A6A6XTS7_9PLEO|nr:hypothetical protein K505DRAFT_320812 [Melanomma pulvis-pyrius CBS 109.77]